MHDYTTTAAGDFKASVPNEGENRTENVAVRGFKCYHENLFDYLRQCR